jgi:hypothetical protein
MPHVLRHPLLGSCNTEQPAPQATSSGTIHSGAFQADHACSTLAWPRRRIAVSRSGLDRSPFKGRLTDHRTILRGLVLSLDLVNAFLSGPLLPVQIALG